jgi:hypothetical protein
MSDFCSIATRQAGQSIVGTAAAETSAWFVLEYRMAWEAKGVEKADLGDPARSLLDGWMRDIPGLRPQLIRTPGRCEGPLTAYVGVSEPGREQLRRLRLSNYEELAELDVPGVIAAMRRGETPEIGEAVSSPVVLVCTHGKRDRCCAKWGQPVYDALQGRADIELWQTSHLGGHRYAATLLCLPQGICYGWVEPPEAKALVDSHCRGEVFRLDRLRGRTALSGPGQATEHFVRDHIGERGLDEVRVLEIESPGGDDFVGKAAAKDQVFTVTFRRTTLETKAPPSCGKEPAAAQRYELSAIAAKPAPGR